ncbi:MAG: hypothetical protein HY243_15815 [Proteobacteria bacterium]|nr:hypothetical protein [Pseudomonadota bacterium]
MNTRALIVAFVIASSASSSAAPAKPVVSDAAVADTARKAIAACLHWAGEEGDNAPERARQIETGVERDCSRANKTALAALKLKSVDPSLATALLKLNDFGYLDVPDVKKAGLCRISAVAFKADYTKTKVADIEFQSLCPADAKKLYGH